jgi:hypothetical protein
MFFKDGNGHLLGSREQGNVLPVEIVQQSAHDRQAGT